MKTLFALLATIWLLILSNPTYAGSCGYKECWGGVGFGPDGKVGWAHGMWSEKEAYKAVLKGCGDACAQVRTFKNSCAAIAKGHRGNWNWAQHPTREEAQQHARDLCQLHTKHCDIVVWACSP